MNARKLRNLFILDMVKYLVVNKDADLELALQIAIDFVAHVDIFDDDIQYEGPEFFAEKRYEKYVKVHQMSGSLD